MAEPWTVVGSTITYEDRWLKVRSDHCVTRAGAVVAPFHVLSYPDWLSVVAVTQERQVVLIREYRHGVGKIILGLPGGVLDPADASPEATARRELREETGHTGGTFTALSCNYANPANQDNMAHLFLALGVRETEPPSLDLGEEIEVVHEDLVAFMERFWRQEVSLQVSHTAAVYAASHAIMTGRDPEHADLRDELRAAFLRQH
jgi:8-oxo-dGTP pyrophosphatase MutT (NUDIX family)